MWEGEVSGSGEGRCVLRFGSIGGEHEGDSMPRFRRMRRTIRYDTLCSRG